MRGFLLVRHRQAWGGIPQAIALSAALSGVASLDLGLDAALSAFLVGLWLAFLVSRWGGLAGVIAARLAAEWMIRRGVF
ncbi:MAG: hypothetical protein JO317_06955 [Verrucomicrobiae bacterium]|nr:hypothetical protein [Verrucomicrobiae bacterium]